MTLELAPDCTLGMGAKSLNNAAKIGHAAKETGLSIDTIRFYEKEGLVKRSSRTEGGFRLFGHAQIQDLKFIRKSQALGFSLDEIRQLLIARSEDAPSCSHVKDMLESKLVGVRQKIEELQALKGSLEVALRKCVRESRTTGVSHAACCPVLEDLAREVGERKSE
ncbi:MAG: heavy metal-responsive transcriptional regulator [Gemmatimonadaceae bacterium]